jgi:hypothetical protein
MTTNDQKSPLTLTRAGIAEQIRRTKDRMEADAARQGSSCHFELEGISTLAHDFAASFTESDPQFDTQRFLSACGFQPEVAETARHSMTKMTSQPTRKFRKGQRLRYLKTGKIYTFAGFDRHGRVLVAEDISKEFHPGNLEGAEEREL